MRVHAIQTGLPRFGLIEDPLIGIHTALQTAAKMARVQGQAGIYETGVQKDDWVVVTGRELWEAELRREPDLLILKWCNPSPKRDHEVAKQPFQEAYTKSLQAQEHEAGVYPSNLLWFVVVGQALTQAKIRQQPDLVTFTWCNVSQ